MSKDVLLAAVMGAQDLKGEVKAKLFTADSGWPARRPAMVSGVG